MTFEELKLTFWDASVDLEVFDPLTTDDVERAEALLGVRLPAEYIALLQVQNGGYVSEEFDAFPTEQPTSWADDHAWLRTLSGIGPDDHHASVTFFDPGHQVAGIDAGLVPLSGDGHWYIALDYRRAPAKGEPAVTWIDTELDQELPLAPSFRAFAEALVPMSTFDEEAGDDEEPFHIRFGERDATYCGYSLDNVRWVPEQRVEEENACPDCLRLRDEWAGKS